MPFGPREFFEALYQGIGGGFLEVRPLLDSSDPRKKSPEGRQLEASLRKFFPVEKNGPERASEYCLSLKKEVHVYFGVGLRKEPGKGTRENIGCVTAAFADIDFKHVTKERTIANLKALPFKPSIIVLSGNGVHVYWLLDYPVFQSKLNVLEALNKKLLEACGAQIGTQDATRILRVPGTINVKPEYDPKPVASIVLFEPSRRYSLEALAEGLNAIPLPPFSAPPPAPKAGGGAPEKNAPSAGEVSVDALPVSDALKGIIKEGLPAYIAFRRQTDSVERFERRQKDNQLSRSEADAHVIAQLLDAGVDEPTIYALYRDPKNRIGEKYRERRDGDRYLAVTIQKMRSFRANHPRIHDCADRIGRQLEREFGENRFDIVKIVKVAYNEPLYYVTTSAEGVESTTRCSDEELDSFRKFRRQYLVQHNRFPPPLKQTAWERLVNSTQFEVRQVEKEISSLDAEIEDALDNWLAQAQPEVTEAVLQYLPAQDTESGRVYLRIKPLLAYLKSEQIEVKNKRDVIQAIKSRGFTLTVKRIGKTTVKLWSRNGQAAEEVVPTQAPPPQDLFAKDTP